jgi:uncharacterized OsmC-like protein
MPSREVNGVNVDGLVQTIDAVKANPTIAKFRFRVGNQWVDGAHNRSIVKEFHGAGQDIQHPQPFTLDADEPPILLGRDLGPNSGEYLLTALAACVTSTLVYHAAARGITIEGVESTVEGDIDLRGFLGIDKSVRNGFQNIRMNLKIQADLSDEQLQELAQLGPAFSPMLDSITKGVPVTVQAERMIKEEASSAA